MAQFIKILAVFANPKGSDPLRLGEEDRTIQECIRRASQRENLGLKVLHAARVRDLQLALLEDDYRVVHFSGHGTSDGRLELEDETGNSKFVSQEALASLLRSFPSVDCVLLNACYTVRPGEPITLGVPYAIAMEGAISDVAAQYFTRGFYDAIGAGKDFRFAFRIGCNAIAMEVEGEYASIPVLYDAAGITKC